MKFNPDIHHRCSIRLKGYDYSQAGAYFVTICTHRRECLFGDVVNGNVILNEYGKCVQFTWNDLPNHNPDILLDAFVIMPNHIHGIIIINPNTVGAGSKPAPKPAQNKNTRAGYEPALTGKRALNEIVRQFKTFSAKRINVLRKSVGVPLWQRNYYEHIIRNETELNKIREYVIYNPQNWETDENNVVDHGDYLKHE